MNLIRNKAFAVVVATFGLAAVLGGSLGLVAAAPREQVIYKNMNLVGYTGRQPIAPSEFLACVEKTGWIGLYRWENDPETNDGRWLHYLNNVPAYVNSPSVNGMDEIPAFGGTILIASKQFNAFFPSRPGEACP
ncbi:MAG: hypothetical protein M0R74_05880 [Dehalococcoidia bacterium]|nr:hypothetical protein [Dehalococcoidia bacterium]